MSLPFTAFSLLLAILVGDRVAAQPRQVSWAPGVRHINLTEDTASQTHEVSVSPGITTAFRFHDATIDRERVLLEGHERMWVAVAEEAILLVPSEQAVPGERLRLAVPFKDSALPGSAVFTLVVHPALAERQVEVYGMRRSAESLGAEVKEKDAQLQQCREKVELLRAELKHPEGLTGLVATGQLDEKGVTARGLLRGITERPGAALRVQTITSFRSVGRVALEMWLDGSANAAPWVAEGGVFRGRAGEELKGLTVWQEVPVASPKRLHVVVEAEATEKEARGPFTLKLWDEGGQRTITLGNVKFP
ncbi:DUF2381 family protein [Myxococcus sp. AM001]|nr:DUF2381 family protein [Myxococcus sp. AM001]